MTIIRCSGSGTSGPERPRLADDEIRDMITTQVTMAVREAIPEVFRSIKTDMIKLFDERYATVSEVDAVVASKEVHMSCYLSMLQTEIREYVST